MSAEDDLFDADTQMRQHRYIIGIDLGTTNSAVAYIDLHETEDAVAGRPIHVFKIPQLVAPGELGPREMLPSFLYLPGEYDLPPGSTALPWNETRDYVVGELAREQGGRVPGRLVSSAKSWLSHSAVDRTAPILPWGANAEIAKVSPIEASRRYLQHIREAWDVEMAASEPAHACDQQLIILTVPASFDEVARELTIEAAHTAGLTRTVLLEEPLAAFYSWLAAHPSNWQSQMRDGQLILVCDVGGGTSDFTIIGIRQGGSGLRFDRLAVGEHLMLGGDNMDMTLGRQMETKLLGQPGKLDSQRWQQLVYQCRHAKETLLSDEQEPVALDITVVGAGGSVIGGTLKGTLTRDEVQRLILDGFFPHVSGDEVPAERPRIGLTELGLPYVQDPAVTRHLAAFWKRYQPFLRDETGRSAVYPDFILFNGGTLIPASIRTRIMEDVQTWFGQEAGTGWRPTELENPYPEQAVALGATYYGLVRLGQGIRVGSGSPRTYYVVVETPDGLEQGIRTGVCLVPRGTEDGFETRLDEPQFIALTNQPVSFQLVTSSTRLGDRLGDVVQLDPNEVSALPPIHSVLRYGKGVVNNIPVRLFVRLTEVGTLELWCEAQQSGHRWQLQFDLRQEVEQSAAPSSPQELFDQTTLDAARTAIQQAFGDRHLSGEDGPGALRKSLEDILGMSRDKWPTQVIRQLADAFLEHHQGRTRSAEHEKRWLNLLGFCLRPGFGDPADDWRMQQVWKVFLQGLAFPKEPQCRSEWWVFWRRVAGGLPSGKQQHVFAQVWPYLQGSKSSKQKPSVMFPKQIRPSEELEVWMTLASFEWLPASTKVTIGTHLIEKFRKKSPSSRELWALGRLGTRSTIYGSLDRVIPSSDATTWLTSLLSLNLESTDDLAYCLVLLAQYTGDRARDVPEEVRERVAQWLQRRPDAARLQELLRNAQRSLQRDEQAWMMGESLPAGLVLTSATSEQAATA